MDMHGTPPRQRAVDKRANQRVMLWLSAGCVGLILICLALLAWSVL